MARITISVCDVCESQSEVQHYEIKVGAKRRVLDLCREHGAPLEDLLARAPKAAKKAAAKAAPGRKVMTMEEIESLKSK